MPILQQGRDQGQSAEETGNAITRQLRAAIKKIVALALCGVQGHVLVIDNGLTAGVAGEAACQALVHSSSQHSRPCFRRQPDANATRAEAHVPTPVRRLRAGAEGGGAVGRGLRRSAAARVPASVCSITSSAEVMSWRKGSQR
jgi:hypothetical protein